MDTVLGLAITPSTIGWVMADAVSSGCPTLVGEEVKVAGGEAGPESADLAAQASAVAAGVLGMVAARGGRLHGVAVTWSDEAAVAAAVLLESLADADVEHVVPVRYSQAAESLAVGFGPRHARSAVCVLEADAATLVLPDHRGAQDPVVTACPISGVDDVVGWLAEALAAGEQRPEMLMVAGSVRGLDRLGRRLESKLSMPVFVQGGAVQGLARGAALVLAPHTELTAATSGAPAPDPEFTHFGRHRHRARSLSYAAALVMLVGGSVTLVASVSAALSMQLSPNRTAPATPAPQRATVARVAVPVAPSAVAPAPSPPPAATAPPSEIPQEPTAESGSLWDAPMAAPDLPEPAPEGFPSPLDRVRYHIYGLPGR